MIPDNVRFYIPSGYASGTQEDIEYWCEYMFSKADDNTGAGSGTWNPEAAAHTSMEKEAPPDTGPVFSIYDPEIQALLAYD